MSNDRKVSIENKYVTSSRTWRGIDKVKVTEIEEVLGVSHWLPPSVLYPEFLTVLLYDCQLSLEYYLSTSILICRALDLAHEIIYFT